jgi:hypothetical protein
VSGARSAISRGLGILFCSNLSMAEFSRTNGPGKTFAFAIEDIFTGINLAIAFISGLIGYVVVEYLRKKI